MNLRELSFRPENEWSYTIGGFFIGFLIGTTISTSTLAALVYATLASAIAWGFSFYDENFSGTF